MGKSGKAEKSFKVKDVKQLADISETARSEPLAPITVDLTISLLKMKTAKEALAWVVDNGQGKEVSEQIHS